jgi:hypothetical protein
MLTNALSTSANTLRGVMLTTLPPRRGGTSTPLLRQHDVNGIGEKLQKPPSPSGVKLHFVAFRCGGLTWRS